MKYFFAAAAIGLIVAFGMPFQKYNTERLLPVLTLQVERKDEVHLVTEVGEGRGQNWDAAVADLRKNAPGDVFFQTAEAVIFCGSPVEEVLTSGLLRPAARVYTASALREPEGLYAYLMAHESSLTVADIVGK